MRTDDLFIQSFNFLALEIKQIGRLPMTTQARI